MRPANPEAVKLAQRLFREAVNLAEAEQRTFVEAACAGDRQIAAEVMGMLEQDRQIGSFLDEGAAQIAHEVLLDAHESFQQLRDFGPYRLQKVLGEGGMGVVCLAEREDIHALVAIKFLRDAWLSGARRERFAVERRMLAQFNHRSIARLYDAGTLDDGTPWFAMEYVDGETVTDYCRKTRSSLAQRLAIFREVCEAVRYAHERAVIHRDLKPSNILVKAGGEVRLLDFGIAKQLDQSDLPTTGTRTEMRLMTPAYAAPEQIRGETAGVFTDVYALGVILYELLSGRAPHELSDLTPHQIEQAILNENPQAPSLVARRGSNSDIGLGEVSDSSWSELDVLCLTAIHQEPERRYRSVDALIRDVDHFIHGEPLDARPDSLRYQAGKFVKRHLAALSVSGLVLLTFLALVTFFTYRLAQARGRAEVALARSERVQQFMQSLFEGGDNQTAPAEGLRVATLIERGANEAEALRSDPEVQAELFETLGGLYQKLGNLDQADRFLSAALKQRIALHGPDQADSVRSLVALSLLRVDQGRLADAEKLAREGLGRANQLRKADGNELAFATSALAKVLETRGDHDQALRLRREALQLQGRGGTQTAQFAADLKGLADSDYYAGNYKESETLTQQSLSLHRILFGEQHPLVAEDLTNLGAIRADRGDYVGAEQFYRQALAIDQTWFGKDNPNTAGDMNRVGRTLCAEKRYTEARSIIKDGLAIRQRAFGPDHLLVANSLNELANVAYMSDQLAEAEALYGQVIEVYKRIYGDGDYRYAIALSNVAGLDMDRKNYKAAADIFRHVVDIETRSLAKDHVYTGIAQLKLGRALLRQKLYAEAEEHSLAGYRIWSKAGKPTVNWLHSARKDLAEIYDGLHRPEEAAAMRAEMRRFDEISAREANQSKPKGH